jgi:FMN phosphatase YigB (HAD superfamily)
MRRPAFIYFDLGNVIVSFDHARGRRQAAALAGLPEAEVERFFRTADRPRRMETGELAWPDLHAAFVRETGVAVDAESLAHALSDIFSLRIEMLPVVAAIERAGIPLGALSNTCDIHWEHIARSNYGILPGQFAPIVLSHEAAAMKPDPAIYAEATRQAGVPPEDIFFCDDIPAHVEAARAVGWDAETFRSAHELRCQLMARGINFG